MAQSSGSRSSNWQAESLRLTVFLAPNVQPKSEGWWEKLARAKSESKTAKPAKGEFFETGMFEGNVLTLSVQLGRIDWVLSPNQSSQDESEIRSLGSFEAAAKIFSKMMSKWLNDCPQIIRLAYGAVLLQLVENREKGYRRMTEYIRDVKIDPKSEDFFYQINRPRESIALKGIRLNRLSRWSVASFQPVRVSFSPTNQPGQPLVYSHGGVPVMACRVELDLSTAAGVESELSHSKLPSVFTELVDLGLEISQRGDIP